MNGLPTEPYTVIRVTSSPEPTLVGQALMLNPADEQYPWENHEDAWPLDYITGFKVLAEPRAVTAKAVLDRIQALPSTPLNEDVHAQIAREFGVES